MEATRRSSWCRNPVIAAAKPASRRSGNTRPPHTKRAAPMTAAQIVATDHLHRAWLSSSPEDPNSPAHNSGGRDEPTRRLRAAVRSSAPFVAGGRVLPDCREAGFAAAMTGLRHHEERRVTFIAPRA